jgi:hemerythrin superfamily protein
MAELKKFSPDSKSPAEKPDVVNTQTEGREKTQDQETHEAEASTEQGQASRGNEDAITLLENDHRGVEKLFQQYRQASRRAEKLKLAQQVCRELIIHTILEEEIFYPACREHMDDEMLDEAQVEHDGAKVLINEILSGSPDRAFYDAKVKVLSEMIKHHVNEEEKRNEGIFAKAKAGGVDVDEIAQRLKARKAELVARAEEGGLERPRPRSFVNATEMEKSMPREQYRERDERGRSDDDDNRRYASRSSRGASRDDDDRRSYGRGQERDERGRFTSEDDDRRYASRSARDDDTRHYSRGQERDERGRFTSDDDDRRYASRSARDDDTRHYSRGQERDERGRFTSEDDDDRRSGGRSRGGWFGDPQGHSEASRRGWEERYSGPRARSRDDEDERRSSGRSQERERDERGRFMSEEDDDRRSGGRSHGGWFGDPQGHSEASKRGWDERYGGARARSRDDEDDERRSSGRGEERERDERGRFVSEDDDERRSSSRGQERERDERGRFVREDDDERRYISRSARGGSRDDDERHYGRGQDRQRDERGRFTSDDDEQRSGGGSGWFGDPEGHSEASKRGWDERHSAGDSRRSSRSGR